MNKRYFKSLMLVLFTTIMFGFSTTAHADSVFVNDGADILSEETENQIIKLNEETFKSYDSFPQVAVYTIENIPDFTQFCSSTIYRYFFR